MPPTGIRTMQQNGTMRIEAPIALPWLRRFFGKAVHDVLPTALASLIGGFLFTQYHFGHAAPQLVDVQPASPEMMAMVRDEHALIMNYLKSQMVAEQRRDQVEDAATAQAVAEARATADAKLADALFASQAVVEQNAAAVVPAQAKAAPVRRKAPAILAAAPHAPLTIAQADPLPNDMTAAAPGEAIAREPNTLLANPLVAKTLDIKDHVVAATRHVVSVIGDMFASVGDSIGGAVSGNRQFNSAS
ncbi:MAG: hypothetical protein WBE99_12920 [Xanthobacteraceae bacterium]